MSCLKRTPLVHEDQRLTHFAALLQKRIANAFCGGGGGGDVIWSNFLFVDQINFSLTPARGYWTRKYPTIQSAINAAQDGDVIYINPGTYAENLDLSAIADGVVIMGSGITSTIIQESVPGPTVSCVRTEKLSGLTFRDLTIQNNDQNVALSIDCEGAPDSFNSANDGINSMFILDRVILMSDIGEGYGVYLNCFNYGLMNDIICGSMFMNNISGLECKDSKFNSSIAYRYDALSEILPSNGKDKVSFSNTRINGGVDLSGQPVIDFDKGCYALELTGTVGQVGNTYNDVARISFHGIVEGVNMRFGANDEYGSGFLVGDFDDAIIQGQFYFNTVTGNSTPWYVSARNATFNTKQFNNIQCCANTGTADAGRARFDMLGAEFVQIALDKNNYGVNRTLYLVSWKVLADGVDHNINIEPPYIPSSQITLEYTVHPEFTSVGNFASMEVGTKTESAFVCRVNIPTECCFKLIMIELGNSPE